MPADQVLVGLLTAGMCGIGLWRREWLLTETMKGRQLARKFGKPNAVRIVTAVLTSGVVGGLLLACDVLRPLRW